MHVTPALGGHVKYGEWLPLHVHLSNDGADVNAEVRADVSGSSGRAVYAAPAPLPAGARKEIVLYVQPPTFAREITVRLVSGEDHLAEATVDVVTHPRSHYLVGVLASEPDAFALLNGLALTGRDQVLVVPLAPATLPARSEALRSLDAVIVAGLDTSALNPAQTGALVRWVEGGGRLVLGGGAGARRVMAGMPDPLRPAEPGEVRDVTAPAALGDFAGYPIQAPGPVPAAPPDQLRGRVIVAEGETPIVVQDNLGQGWVGYLALDPAAAPFHGWGGALRFWQRLFAPGAGLEANVPRDIPARALESEQMGYALANLPSLELPSVRWLTVLLAVYILLVGPVNYLALRRLGRLSAAWITIPALTLLFSVGSYGLGYTLRGSDVIVHQIGIVPLTASTSMEGDPTAATNGDVAARAYVGLFSPSRGNYDLRVGGNTLIGPLSQQTGGRPAYGTTSAGLEVVQGETTLVREMWVNQWAMQSFQAETHLPGVGRRLTSDLVIDADGVRGTVRNDLDDALEDVLLLMGHRFAPLGDVAAGETLVVDRAFAANTSGAPFPWALFQDEEGMGVDRSSRASRLRQSILGAFFHTNWGPAQVPASPMLLAWSDEPILDVTISQRRASHQATTLVVQYLPLPVKEGRVSLPPGMVGANLLTSEGEAGTCGPTGQVYLADGEVTLAYQLPSNLRGIRTTRLTLQAGTEGGAWGESPAVALYDWTQGAWAALDPMSPDETVEIPDPDRFVDAAGGVIHLRAAAASNTGSKCYRFDVGLEGELATAQGAQRGGSDE
jgi:hypothetical protein